MHVQNDLGRMKILIADILDEVIFMKHPYDFYLENNKLDVHLCTNSNGRK